MPDKKIELLPFAPYSTKAIEDRINEEARRGWQVAGAVPFIPILIKFSRGDGGLYHILMDDPDEKDSVCVLPGCGQGKKGSQADEYPVHNVRRPFLSDYKRVWKRTYGHSEYRQDRRLRNRFYKQLRGQFGQCPEPCLPAYRKAQP